MVLLGQVEPLRIDLDEMEQRIDYRGGSKMAQSLAEIGMNSPVDLFATYAGRSSDLTEWLRDVPMNRDRNLRMQYLAGLGLNLDDAAAIYAGLLSLQALSRGSLPQRGRAGGLACAEAIRRQQLSAHVFGQPSRHASAYKADGSPLANLALCCLSR